MALKVMVDIETLSTQKNAAMISWGMAAFDDDFVIDSLGCAIEMKEVFGHIDPGTVQWWMGQGESARAYSFRGGSTQVAAAISFKGFFEQHKPDEVWANSPTFDLVILENWWKGLPANTQPSYHPGRWPVSYRSERDCRTLFALAKQCDINTAGAWDATTVAHNPVDDACNQARAVIMIRKELERCCRPNFQR